MMSGLHDGRIKALYLIGENPAQTEPNATHVEEGSAKLDFVVSQDLFLNETRRSTPTSSSRHRASPRRTARSRTPSGG